MTESKAPRRRGGRPPKPLITQFRATCWFYAVAEATGETSGYALDELFPLGRPRRIRSTDRPKSACKFDKYRRGEHLPEPALVELVGEQYPATKTLFYHPFWQLAEPNIDIEQVEHQIAMLPGIYRYAALGTGLIDNVYGFDSGISLTQVAEMGGIDALASCLGRLHGERLLGEFGQPLTCVVPTVEAFVRSFAFEPYAYVHDEFQAYLFNTLLKGPMSELLESEKVQKRIQKHGKELRICRDIIQSLDVLQPDDPPETALYLVERVVPRKVLNDYAKRSLRTRDEYFRQLPVAVELLELLKTWQRNGRQYIPQSPEIV